VNPIGWRADVRYVPSGENRSHGSTLGVKLRRFCNGTHFRYVFLSRSPESAFIATSEIPNVSPAAMPSSTPR
jgi:hypothetical protein